MLHKVQKGMLTLLGMRNENFLPEGKMDKENIWSALHACEKLTPNSAISRGKNAKSQHEPQFLSELTTCKREQKMDNGVLVDM